MITKKLNAVMLSAFALLCVSCSQEKLGQNDQNDTTTTAQSGVFTPSDKNDSLALVSIYKALDGANWKHSNWLRTPVRYWQGVTLEQIGNQNRVVSLKLYGDELKGQLPIEIKMLTELRKLAIAQSDFVTGTIIDEVFDLKKLVVLDFQFTCLTGELSPRIGELTQLDTLNLWKSRFEAPNGNGDVNWDANSVFFSGAIPSEIGKLTALRYLNFARAGFEGSIPAQIGELANITRLDLSENRLTGSIPAEIGRLANLEWVALCDNNLTGSIPDEVCNARALKTFIVSRNKLTGSIPAEIGNIPNIGYLGFEDNALTGSLPASLENSRKLGLLYAANNKLSGTIPSEFGRRNPWLIQVHLQNNNIEGSIPDIVANDSGSGKWIALFYVAGNKMSGNVPAELMAFPQTARETVLPQQAGYGFDNLK